MHQNCFNERGEPATTPWLFHRIIGKGGFSTVYEVTNANQKPFACKVIKKSRLNKTNAKQKLMTEIKIHRHMQQMYICQFDSFFDDEENIYLFLELCPCGSLHDMVRNRKKISELEM